LSAAGLLFAKATRPPHAWTREFSAFPLRQQPGPASGHFKLNGVLRAAKTTFAVRGRSWRTFIAGRAGGDDLFVNACDGAAFSGPTGFHIDIAKS
jgi:hypothetical protein